MSETLFVKFADGEYNFRLNIAELRELESVLDFGCIAIMSKFSNNLASTDDIRHVVRLGLIGGGLDPKRALDLVKYYLDERSDWITGFTIATSLILKSLVIDDIEGEDLQQAEKKPDNRAFRVKVREKTACHSTS